MYDILTKILINEYILHLEKNITDKKLAEIFDIEYRTLLNWKKTRPKVYAALHDAVKFKELREEFCKRKD